MYDDLYHPGEASMLQQRQDAVCELRGVGDPEVADFLRNELLRSAEVVSERLRREGGSITELVLGSAAKGGPVNLGTMAGVIGLQEVYGKASVQPLPCYAPDTTAPEASCYVRGNYMHGLSPADVFKMSGPTRQQMSDQSIYTGVVGHLKRKIQVLLKKSTPTGRQREPLGHGSSRSSGGDGLQPAD